MKTKQLCLIPIAAIYQKVKKKDTEAMQKYNDLNRATRENGMKFLENLKAFLQENKNMEFNQIVNKLRGNQKDANRAQIRLSIAINYCLECSVGDLNITQLTGHGRYMTRKNINFNISKNIALFIDSSLDAFVQKLSILSSLPLFKNYETAYIEEVLKNQFSVNLFLQEEKVFVLDENNNIFADNSLSLPFNFNEDFKDFNVSLLTPLDPYLSDVYWKTVTPKLDIAVSILSSSENFGAIIAEFSIQRISSFILEYEISSGGYVFITDRYGNVIIHPESNYISERRKLTQIGFPSNNLEHYGNLEILDTSGKKYIFTFNYSRDKRFGIFILQPDLNIFELIYNNPFQILIILTTIILITTITSFFIYSYIINPVNKLSREMTLVSTGKITSDIYNEYGMRKDEIGNALNSFNDMLKQIKVRDKQKNKLVRKKKRLLVVLDNINKDLEIKIKQRTKDLENVNDILKDTVQQANAANKAKTKFLYSISHDIRSPLNSILGFSDIIEKSDDKQKNIRYLNSITIEAERILELLNTLLDLSKIEAGKLELLLKPFNIYSFLEEMCSGVSIIAQNKGIKFQLNIIEHLPEIVIGDSLRLGQVVYNLLGNAVKFTKEGSVTISVEIKLRENEKIIMLFKITDTGIGIPIIKQDSIFETYTQAENDTTHKYGGTGLGTSIAKQLVEMMNGEIGLESEAGIGTTFWFTAVFDIKQEFKDIIEHKDNEKYMANLKNLSILLVEDSSFIQEIASTYLKRAGCRVIVADNGKMAVDICEVENIDFILMDVQMPIMNGYEAAEIIRSRNPKVPIIGLTGNISSSDIEKCMKCGMDDVLSKPFTRDSLLSAIFLWFNRDNEIKVKKEKISYKDNNGLNNEQNNKQNGKQINLDKLLVNLGGDRILLEKVLSSFIENLHIQIRIIDNAISNKDLDTLKLEAHSIKGGSLTACADKLADAALGLENIEDEHFEEKSIKLFELLKIEIDRISAYLIKSDF